MTTHNRNKRNVRVWTVLTLAAFGSAWQGAFAAESIEDLAELASGWRGEIVAEVDQSYVGWDVEIGDADNDGKNEILTTGCPDSRLYLFKKLANRWETRLLAEDLAQRKPEIGMGLAVKIDDLNRDGVNEIVLGTGQEADDLAYLYVLATDGKRITKELYTRSLERGSVYTHNLGIYDIDNDGVKEILSAYCSSGEVMRYDLDPDLTTVSARKVFHSPGSGEDSFLADVDNDGDVEYLTCSCYREGEAEVYIFELTAEGDLVTPPRVVLNGFDDKSCFNCSLEVGDVDNDGQNELIVEWKERSDRHEGTILGYRVDREGANPIYTFMKSDRDLDLGFNEKMMCVADADNDGKNELVVSTRGERRWGGRGLGHLFMFKVLSAQAIEKTLLLNFHDGKADACWPAVGDADNDGENEIVIATGSGLREEPGISHVVLIEKE